MGQITVGQYRFRLLSFVSSGIEETLDTLRLASSAISQNKLSLGGKQKTKYIIYDDYGNRS